MIPLLYLAVVLLGVWYLRGRKAPPVPPIVQTQPWLSYGREMQLYRPYQFTDLMVATTGALPENPYLADLAALRPSWQPPVAVDAPVPPAIQFKAHEPRQFADLPGQAHIRLVLDAAIRALPTDRLVIGHRLLTGLPGRGKTLIAKILAHALQERARALGQPVPRYVETFAANLATGADLDAVARTLLEAGGGVWFIDELHVLDQKLATKLYALMEDGKYPFHGDVNPTTMPPVCVLGATTDYGALHAALKRRFGEPLMVRPLDQAAIREVVARVTDVTPEAADALVARTHWGGSPWEAVSLATEAQLFARADGRAQVTLADVTAVCDAYDIDAYGLRWIDREVLQVLYRRPRYRGKQKELVAYAASEADLCAMSGLDPEEYRAAVKPRLMARGLVEVLAGYGQALTAQGLALVTSSRAGDDPGLQS